MVGFLKVGETLRETSSSSRLTRSFIGDGPIAPKAYGGTQNPGEKNLIELMCVRIVLFEAVRREYFGAIPEPPGPKDKRGGKKRLAPSFTRS